MRKILVVLFVSIIALTGCAETDTQNQEVDNGLLETGGVDKVLTASNVESATSYEFAVSSEVVDDLDTYELEDFINITIDDDKSYKVDYKSFEGDDVYTRTIEEQSGKLTAKEGYYTLTSTDESDSSVNVTIAVQ